MSENDYHARRLHTLRPFDHRHQGNFGGDLRGQERRQLLPEQLRLGRGMQGGREVREAVQGQLRALPLLRVRRRVRLLGRRQGQGASIDDVHNFTCESQDTGLETIGLSTKISQSF